MSREPRVAGREDLKTAHASSEFSLPLAMVFLLAENRLLREALLRILSSKNDIQVVGAAASGSSILEQIVSSNANVLVSDSIAPVVAEQGMLKELRRRNPAIRVVMVGMEQDEAAFLRVVRAGVLGYVLKDASAVEIARTIRAVAAGEGVCPGPLSVSLFQWVASNGHTTLDGQLKESLGLTLREKQLIGLIQNGLTNKEMAGQLHLPEQTVKNHVHRILRKVGATNRLSIAAICRDDRPNI